jgi:signal recognition particle receptor subunit beta
MVFINYLEKQIEFKIVYYGPGLSGKTTNLKYIYDKLDTKTRGPFTTIPTQTERTLYFDFLPMGLGKLGNYDIKFSLYTVPGQVFYSASRKLILKGVDGIIFVADSQEDRLDANIESINDLIDNLNDYKIDFHQLPYLLQLNKRDLKNILSVEELKKELQKKGEPIVEAVAMKGEGVFKSLKLIAKLVLRKVGNINSK